MVVSYLDNFEHLIKNSYGKPMEIQSIGLALFEQKLAQIKH